MSFFKDTWLSDAIFKEFLHKILILSDHLKYAIIGEEDDTDDIKQTSF